MTTKLNESLKGLDSQKGGDIGYLSRWGTGGGAGLNMVTFAKSEKAANILS